MKILMVGLGGIGQRHVRNLRTLADRDLEIIAYRQRDSALVLTDQLQVEEGSNLAEKYAISVFRDFEQALEQQPDAVFICNPTSLHIPYALQAAHRGCQLFVEKPLSHNLEGVQELIGVVEARGLRAVVGYQMRFHPCLTKLKVLLQSEAIGRILSVRTEIGEYLPGWHVYEDYRQMYASRKELGGGVVLSQIHELDYLYWLFGLPQRVYAVGGHLSSLEIDVEDTADMLMEYRMDNGSIPVSVHVDYVQRPPRRICQLVGDDGKIDVDLRAFTVNVWNGEGSLVEAYTYEGFQRNQLFLEELKCFLESTDGEPLALPSIREGAQSLRIALAAKESLLTGNLIDLRRGAR